MSTYQRGAIRLIYTVCAVSFQMGCTELRIKKTNSNSLGSLVWVGIKANISLGWGLKGWDFWSFYRGTASFDKGGGGKSFFKLQILLQQHVSHQLAQRPRSVKVKEFIDLARNRGFHNSHQKYMICKYCSNFNSVKVKFSGATCQVF